MPSESAASSAPFRLDRRSALALVGLLTLAGLALRLARFGDPLFGDELSTLNVINRSFGEMLGEVSSDAEISPPLYFAAAWLASKLGSAPELIRLPALVAGVASILLTYAVGARAVSRPAGLIAATLMALSPFMIFYSTDGRGYAVAIALLLVTTLAMLLAADGGGRRWWVVYGLATCLAMYTHYTSAFVLVAQLLWLAWAHREAIRPALFANVGAAALFIPWLPGALADTRSPTLEILDALQGSGLRTKLEAIATWAFGYPFVQLSQIPGRVLLVVATVAMFVAAVAALRFVRSEGRLRVPAEGLALLLAIGLATPVAEIGLLLLTGNDLLGARNLNTSSAGLSLSLGAILAAAGPLVGGISTAIVVLVFGLGSIRTLEAENTVIRFEQAAAFIDSEARPGDVVVDAVSAVVTPVPLTPLDLYLERPGPDYTPFLPVGPPPFLPFSSDPAPASEQLEAALEDADGGGRLIVVTGAKEGAPSSFADADQIRLRPLSPSEPLTEFSLPPGSRLLEQRSFPGVVDIDVAVIDPGG